jgi:hypothetical protein
MGELIAPDLMIVLFLAIIAFLVYCVVLFVRSRRA